MTLDGPDSDGATGRLMGMLAARGFIRSPEVAVTTALAWLAHRPLVAEGLRRLAQCSGVAVSHRATWTSEVIAEDRTRTDLECIDGDPPAPVVVVEAKLGAMLTAQQLHHYAMHQHRLLLQAGHAVGLVVALVPAHRRGEAELRLGEAVGQDEAPFDALDHRVRITSAVWTYDELLDAIQDSNTGDPDIDQLRALIAYQEAIDIRPFTEEELVSPGSARLRDVQLIADRISAAVSAEMQLADARLMPGGADGDFTWRRYVIPTLGGPNFAIGVRRTTDSPAPVWPTPLWLRVHRALPMHERSLSG